VLVILNLSLLWLIVSIERGCLFFFVIVSFFIEISLDDFMLTVFLIKINSSFDYIRVFMLYSSLIYIVLICLLLEFLVFFCFASLYFCVLACFICR